MINQTHPNGNTPRYRESSMCATSLRKLTAFRVVTAAFTAMEAPASIMEAPRKLHFHVMAGSAL